MGPLKTPFLTFLLVLSSTRAGAATASSIGVPSGVQAHAEFRNAQGGLRDIMFSFDLSKVDHEYSWQFGAAFWFGHAREDVAYIAIQPYATYIRASFYSFTPGATTKYPQVVQSNGNWNPGCTGSADGVEGVSCHNFLTIENYDGLFNLSVTNSGGNTWTGKFINTATGDELVAGEWTLPHSGAITPGVDYFLEALTGTDRCTGIPGTVTTLVRPYSVSTGESAELQKPYPIGPCRDSIRYEPHDASMGIEVTVQGGSKRSRNMPVANEPQAPAAQRQQVSDQPRHKAPENSPQQQQGPGPAQQGENRLTGELSVPWQTERQHEVLCRGYNGNDQACISGYENAVRSSARTHFHTGTTL